MYSVEQLTLGDKSHLMMILYGMAMTHQYLLPWIMDRPQLRLRM